MRRDAQRNHARLIAAARELLAAGGVDVSVRDIARHAGVGVATLYRHFPAREDLVDAVLEDAFEEFIALAEDALQDPDPWSGFTTFFERSLTLHARNRGLKDVVETYAHGRDRATAMRGRIGAVIARLVERAQANGALRPDFSPQDVPVLFWSSARVIELAGDVAPGLWRRQLGFVLDGLRASAAHPLPQPPLSEWQLQRVGTR
jgi:AcrR family transcriptional regulator